MINNMMARDELLNKYWKYYLLLEKEFISTLDYVELNQANFNTFSNRYAVLVQSVGAELDNFFKVFCGLTSDSYSNIKNYAEMVNQIWPEIKDQRIEVISYSLQLQPFKDWDVDHAKESLQWWKAFDDIKHARTDNMNRATQLNVINILAALFLLEMKELSIIADGKEPDIPDSPSSLFEPVNWNYRFLPVSEGFAFKDHVYSMTDTKRVHWG